MKILFFALFLGVFSFTSVWAANNYGSRQPQGNVSQKIIERNNKSDAMNRIDTDMNRVRGSKDPGAAVDMKRYERQKSDLINNRK